MLPMMSVSLNATAQSVGDVSNIQNQTDSVTINTKIWDVVEQMPQFPLGYVIDWVNSQVVYPEEAKALGIQGRVIVQYVINEDGSISDAHIIRGIDPQLDKEALRIINSMPTWKPGMQDGKPVKTRWNTPVSFTFILPAEEQQPIHNNNEETNE